MLTCARCKTQLADGSAFCTSCGAAVTLESGVLEKGASQQVTSRPPQPAARSGNLPKFRSASFGLAIFCFVLPFMTMSCPGGRFIFTGIQMVTGTTVQDEKLGAEPLAILALLCAIAGLALSFGTRDVATGVTGVAGAIALFLLKASVDSKTLEKGGGMVQVSFGFGFWLALLALVAGAALSYQIRQQRTLPSAPQAPTPGASPGQT